MNPDTCNPLFGFNPASCISGLVSGWAASIPWWAWLVAAILVVGIVYKLAGWLGVVALAGGAGYIARAEQDAVEHGNGEPPPPAPRPKTIFDYFKGN